MKQNKFDKIMDVVDTIINIIVTIVLVFIIGSIIIDEYNYTSTIGNENFEEVIVEAGD